MHLHSCIWRRWEDLIFLQPPSYLTTHKQTLPFSLWHGPPAPVSSTLTLHTSNTPRSTTWEQLRARENLQRSLIPTSCFQTGLDYNHLILISPQRKKECHSPQLASLRNIFKSLTQNHTPTLRILKKEEWSGFSTGFQDYLPGLLLYLLPEHAMAPDASSFYVSSGLPRRKWIPFWSNIVDTGVGELCCHSWSYFFFCFNSFVWIYFQSQQQYQTI